MSIIKTNTSANNLTTSNVLRSTDNSGNTISTTKTVREPYYDTVIAGKTPEEVASMPIRGHFDCARSVDSYFAHIVAEWVCDDTIVPFGYVISDGVKHYYWGNDDVVFWATMAQLLTTKEEVEQDGYNGQLSCFSWETIVQCRMTVPQFSAFSRYIKRDIIKELYGIK